MPEGVFESGGSALSHGRITSQRKKTTKSNVCFVIIVLKLISNVVI